MTDTPDYASGQLDVVVGERPDLKDRVIDELREKLAKARENALKEAADFCRTHEVGTNPRLGYVISERHELAMGQHVGEEYARQILAIAGPPQP